MRFLTSVTLVVAAGVLVVPEMLACGGCYNEFEVADLRTEPATGCLMLGASEVDQCTADYDVTVQNGCVEALTVGSQTIGAGASGRIRGAEVPADGAGRHSIEGMVGAAPVTISWVLVDTSDE